MSLVQLEEDFVDVINLGKSWGMSEYEIQECLNAVMNLQPFLASSSPSSTTTTSSPAAAAIPLDNTYDDNKRKLAPKQQTTPTTFISMAVWAAMKSCHVLKSALFWVFMLGLFLSAFYTALLVVCSLSPTLENRIGKLTTPLVYPTMRMARIALKPLADAFEISSVYSAECLVENPFFIDPVDDCEPCKEKSVILDLTGQPVKEMVYNIEDFNPFVIRGYMEKKVDLPILQKMYFENERLFKMGGTRMFASNFQDVYNITDFFNKYNYEDIMNVQRGTGYVAWDTNSVPSSQAIRKVFPRPKFVLDQSEISLLKRIHIEGPIAGGHELPIGGFANSWYVQAHGRRHIKLVPHPDCSEECEEMTIVLNAGDLVFYQDQFWRLASEPVVEAGSTPLEISIAFSASFTL